jgi:hypothetical protein
MPPKVLGLIRDTGAGGIQPPWKRFQLDASRYLVLKRLQSLS